MQMYKQKYGEIVFVDGSSIPCKIKDFSLEKAEPCQVRDMGGNMFEVEQPFNDASANVSVLERDFARVSKGLSDLSDIQSLRIENNYLSIEQPYINGLSFESNYAEQCFDVCIRLTIPSKDFDKYSEFFGNGDKTITNVEESFGKMRRTL